MAEYKRQHYVPKFYLTAFSPNGGKSIGVFNLAQQKVIPAGGLATQCYEDYFYGKEPQTEKALSETLEGPASITIRNIINSAKLPAARSEDLANLLAFIVFQSNRTLAANQQVAEITKAFADKLFKKMALASGDFTPEELNSVELTLDRPVNLAVQHATGVLPLIIDLKAKLLVNQTQQDFITSDDPVVKTNQYLLGAFEGGVTGWATTGLQVFLPLSAKLAVFLYDSRIYKVGTRNAENIFLSQLADVDALNILQLLNSHQNAYFRHPAQGNQVLHLYKRCAGLKQKGKTKTRLFPTTDELGRPAELQHTYGANIDFREPLSFCKIQTAKRIPLSERCLTVREPELVTLHRMFHEKVNTGDYHENDWLKFLNDCANEHERKMKSPE